MTSLHRIAKTAEKLFSDNSPAILTGIGVTGAITTAVLAAKGGIKATHYLSDKALVMTKREYIERTWRFYVPAIGTGVFTVASIVMANRVGTRRAAAMATAYTLSQEALSEYKEKVYEQFGKNKEQKVRDEIAQDRVTAQPVGRNEVFVTGGGEVLCHDLYTARYFESSMETLKKAQNDINYQILNNDYASLTDFYNKIGLSGTKFSDDVGWNTDKLLELQFSTTISDDQRPCIAIDFVVAPIRNYFRMH